MDYMATIEWFFNLLYIYEHSEEEKVATMLPGPTIFSPPSGSRRSFGTLPVCKFQYNAIAFSPYPSPSSPDLCTKTYYITYSPYYVILNIRMYYVKLKRFYFLFLIYQCPINNTWFGCSRLCRGETAKYFENNIYHKLKCYIRKYKHKYTNLFYSGNSF